MARTRTIRRFWSAARWRSASRISWVSCRSKPDGSAYFEVPSGRAVYLQALDEDGRLVQSMRTFVQAAPGVTRSCIGCHEHKQTAAQSVAAPAGRPAACRPANLQPESWGSGFLDYASMVQPILNRHCVRCHGGEEGISNGVDLSGGWTEHFNISYETLTNRCETQLTAYWIAGIDCMNGTALWSAQIFPPRSHGSGAAPLAKQLMSGHEGRIGDMTRPERDLLFAWMDTNGVYYGTWNRTASGCAIPELERHAEGVDRRNAQCRMSGMPRAERAVGLLRKRLGEPGKPAEQSPSAGPVGGPRDEDTVWPGVASGRSRPIGNGSTCCGTDMRTRCNRRRLLHVTSACCRIAKGSRW